MRRVLYLLSAVALLAAVRPASGRESTSVSFAGTDSVRLSHSLRFTARLQMRDHRNDLPRGPGTPARVFLLVESETLVPHEARA